jgi:isoleucyl-tRNA synthetase
MKVLSQAVAQMGQEEIAAYEQQKSFALDLEGTVFELQDGDLEVMADDIPGWLVASEGDTTVALDIQIDEELRQEGLARELVNRIQNLRKELDLDLTDRIRIGVECSEELWTALDVHAAYISREVLAVELSRKTVLKEAAHALDLEGIPLRIDLEKAATAG